MDYDKLDSDVRDRLVEAVKKGHKGDKPLTDDELKEKVKGKLLEEECAKVNEGKKSDYMPSKEEMMKAERMGLMLTRAKFVSALARRLAARAGVRSRFARTIRVASPSSKTIPEKDEPTLVSIFLRHSRNKGDELTDDGKKLAREQGRKTAEHLIEQFLKSGKSAVIPTIVLNVSHGGGGTPGQTDWAFEHLIGKPVKEFGGQVSHAEGLMRIGYADGSVKDLYIRQHGIVHLH